MIRLPYIESVKKMGVSDSGESESASADSNRVQMKQLFGKMKCGESDRDEGDRNSPKWAVKINKEGGEKKEKMEFSYNYCSDYEQMSYRSFKIERLNN